MANEVNETELTPDALSQPSQAREELSQRRENDDDRGNHTRDETHEPAEPHIDEAPAAALIEDEGAFGAVDPAIQVEDDPNTDHGRHAIDDREERARDHERDREMNAREIASIEHADRRRSTSTVDLEAPSFMSEVPDSFSYSDEAATDEMAPPDAGIESAEHESDRHRETPRLRSEPRSPDSVMLVNDVPGDECRIALVRKGRLEAFFGERDATATNVGNIYKGRVINVEPAIQAAFIDFGQSQNGFLHVSDLHPRYFPGVERTEKVGRKIPRRDRPLIQEALKRGQEILVQVIKEGLGTKGPTLTSYLSIPGRLLVMMPDMDNVGVSRKVDDEEQRRQMRQILDSLDLREGFGFILRTAGFDRSRVELQRDAAYLTRLWDAMEKRMERSGAPCELYTESDLLLRTIRDVVDDSVSAIVVDSESAFDRASLFLEVAFPKDPPQVRFYDRGSPIFHAFGIEPQVRSIYSREVPLLSGGALVFDQAEALLAIDVNSGKSRSARDSETNAFNTNREAVDEICRQLRLRDLGGLVVCDLIDMRSAKHRREIEDRFRENLRRDRAKTTVLPISEFGIIELTRQRMRPSVQKMHFMDCPHCEGIGQVQIPDSTAAAALRDVQALLGHERVFRVEMVCSVKVASVMLSSKRDRLFEMERRTGKRVDVRISEALPVDRIDLYGYDDRGADVELSRLALPKAPAADSLPSEPPEEIDVRGGGGEAIENGGRTRSKRRRRPAPADAASIAMAGGFDDLPEVRGDEPSAIDEIRASERAKRAADAARAEAPKAKPPVRPSSRAELPSADRDDGAEGGRGRRRRKRGGRGRGRDGASGAPDAAATPDAATAAPGRRPAGDGPTRDTRDSKARSAPPVAVPPPPPAEARRVHLLAKEFGISSKDLLIALRERETTALPLEAKNHMSMLPPAWVTLAQRIYAPEPAPVEAVDAFIADDDDGTASERGAPGDDTRDGAQGPRGDGEGGRRKRRRRRRGGRGGGGGGGGGANGGNGRAPSDAPSNGVQGGGSRQGRGPEAGATEDRGPDGDGAPPIDGEGGVKRKRRRRRRGGRGGGGGGASRGGEGGGGSGAEGNSGAPRGSGEGNGGAPRGNASGGSAHAAPAPAPAPRESAPAPAPKPRGLYARGVRRLSGPVKYDDR